MRQANYKQQAMYTIQQSKKVSVKTCVVKIRHTKQKKKKKSVPVDSLRVDTPAMRAADYKLYRPKSTVKNIGVKAM
jgi:RNA-binding protein YlmH